MMRYTRTPPGAGRAGPTSPLPEGGGESEAVRTGPTAARTGCATYPLSIIPGPGPVPSNLFGGDQVGEGLAATDQAVFIACDEDFGGAESAVVVGTHGHAVGAGAERRQQVAAAHRRQPAVA